MNNGKRYVFYDNQTGEKIVTEARNRIEIMPTVERVIEIYPALHDRHPASYDVLILNYDDFAQDFVESNGYRVNPETKTLEFSYPDPNEPEAPPVFVKPLTEQIAEVKAENESLNLAVIDIYEIILG